MGSTPSVKILAVFTEFPPGIGGMQTHALLLGRLIHEMGSQIQVFTYRCHEESEECRKMDETLPFPVHRVLSRISYMYNIRLLTEYATKNSPDWIYASTIFYGILQKTTGIRTVCRSVGNDILRPWIVYPYSWGSRIVALPAIERPLYNYFRKMHKPEWLEILLRKTRLRKTVESAREASLILANSKYTQKMLTAHGIHPENMEMLVGGVDAEFFSRPDTFRKEIFLQNYGIAQDARILLTVCRLVDKKGVDFLLETLAHILSGQCKNPGLQNQNWHLVVVGDGRRYEKYVRLSQLIGIRHRVTFTGRVPYEQTPPFYWAADFFILASIVHVDKKTRLRDAETMGRVLCEANAAGCPVLASKSGGIPSVIQHQKNGLLFRENSRQDFLEKLSFLWENPQQQEIMVENGKTIAKEKFDWSHILSRHKKIFFS